MALGWSFSDTCGAGLGLVQVLRAEVGQGNTPTTCFTSRAGDRWSTYSHGFCIFVGGDSAIQNGPKCSPEVLSGLLKLGRLRYALWGNTSIR